MKTIIVTEKGNQTVEKGVRFQVLIGSTTKMMFDTNHYETYSEAESRAHTLNRMLKGYKSEPVAVFKNFYTGEDFDTNTAFENESNLP